MSTPQCTCGMFVPEGFEEDHNELCSKAEIGCPVGDCEARFPRSQLGHVSCTHGLLTRCSWFLECHLWWCARGISNQRERGWVGRSVHIRCHRTPDSSCRHGVLLELLWLDDELFCCALAVIPSLVHSVVYSQHYRSCDFPIPHTHTHARHNPVRPLASIAHAQHLSACASYRCVCSRCGEPVARADHAAHFRAHEDRRDHRNLVGRWPVPQRASASPPSVKPGSVLVS